MMSMTSIRKRLVRDSMDLASLMGYYRYLSLLITSAFYIAGPHPSYFYVKAIIVLCLFLEALIFNRLFHAAEKRGRFIKVLVTVETLGLAMMLILTGGLDSPFLWYAINPILMAATLLPHWFCWLMMALFLSAVSVLQRFEIYGLRPALIAWPDSYSFILIFVLVTLAAQLFNYFIRRLSQQSEIMEAQLRHIRSLYDAAGIFSMRSDPQEIVNLFASYTKTMTGADKVFIWVETDELFRGSDSPVSGKSYHAVRGPRRILGDESWYPHVRECFSEGMENQDMFVRKIASRPREGKGTLFSLKIKTGTRVYGIITTYFQNEPQQMEMIVQTLRFNADLCAVALEKNSLESVKDESLIMEENDRIAQEIHDNVTQNIFGVIHGIDLLVKRDSLPQDVNEQLRIMQKTAKRALKDLRVAIYRMSALKNDQESFQEDLEKYLHDLGQLNKVNVYFHPTGPLQYLSPHIQRSLYRIIREATSNAIRHGHCSRVAVRLDAQSDTVTLDITDDGIGFESARAEKGMRHGMGLLNMRELARGMGSNLILETVPGKGTHIFCEVSLISSTKLPGEEKEFR